METLIFIKGGAEFRLKCKLLNKCKAAREGLEGRRKEEAKFPYKKEALISEAQNNKGDDPSLGFSDSRRERLGFSKRCPEL